MVLPPGHYQQTAKRSPFSRMEKWTLGGVVVVLAVFAVVLVIALTGPTQSTARGCVDVSILGATGGAAIHQCGGNARALCRAVGKPTARDTGVTGQEIRAACRKDGFPVG
jgi:hypothetical protein